MINKAILIIALTSLLYSVKLFSQTTAYGYDNNGNRTIRTLFIVKNHEQKADTMATTADTLNALADNANMQKNQVETTISNSKVQLYPNPVQYNLAVNIESLNNNKANIIIADEFGKITDNIKVTNSNNIIDFSQKARGVYFIKITIDGKSESWKIIKE